MSVPYPYAEYMKHNCFEYCGEGYMHCTYKKNGFVYKIVKPERGSFGQTDHFELELHCLRYLEANGYRVVKVMEVFHPGAFIDDYAVLKEEYIPGIVYTYNNINKPQVLVLLEFLDEVSKLKVDGFGFFSLSGRGSFPSWLVFLEHLINNIGIVSILLNKKYDVDFYYKSLKNLPNCERGCFLVMDPSPGNFIFSNDNTTVAIDIDHPVIGDSLYQWGCVKWYMPTWFMYLKEIYNFNKDDLFAIDFYELLFGFYSVKFELESTIECTDRIHHLDNIIKNFLTRFHNN